MEFEFLLDGAPRTVRLENRDRTFLFTDGEAVVEAEVRQVTANELLFLFNGRSARVYLARDGDRTLIAVAGRTFVVTKPLPGRAGWPDGEGRIPEGRVSVKAPMPGRVIKLCVREKDEVRRNQTLVIVEAMKMENEIQSPAGGIVKTIYTAVGDFVDAEKPLVEIEVNK
jgi:biotin carboxyl carrier protein